MRYWKNGFYDEPVDGGVEITDEYWQKLYDGQSDRQQIVVDRDGYPVLQYLPEPGQEQIDMARIATLKNKLSSSDWCVIKCMETGMMMQEAYSDVYAERVAARAEIKDLESRIN